MIYFGFWQRGYDHRQLQNRTVSPEGWFLGRGNPRDIRLLRMDGNARSSSSRAGENFAMIADEYRDKGLSFPADSTEILHA
jgi:hypothetical protein